MKTVKIAFAYHTQEYVFENDEQAAVAYEKVKAACVKYREFLNAPEDSSVEFSGGAMGENTVRLAAIGGVSLIDLNATEAPLVEIVRRNARIKTASDAAEAANNPVKGTAPAVEP